MFMTEITTEKNPHISMRIKTNNHENSINMRIGANIFILFIKIYD